MAEEFFTRALAWQQEKGYNVYHETHRKRFLHSPWVARRFMPRSIYTIYTIYTLSTISSLSTLFTLSTLGQVPRDEDGGGPLPLGVRGGDGPQRPGPHCRHREVRRADAAHSLQVQTIIHHIHNNINNVPLSRVGYDHGPQVPDPRAADWLPYMEVVEGCSR